MARSRAFVGTALAVVVLAATSACGLAGFGSALAHPQAQQSAADGTTVPTPVTPGPPPEQAHVVAQAPVMSGGRQEGDVVVTLTRLVTSGVPPIPLLATDCQLDAASVQYAALELAFTDTGDDGGPAGHLTVSDGPATPPDVGDLGVFIEPASANESYCTTAPPLPRTDTFWARGTAQVDGYVVLAQAVGPATPQGRADVFPTLQLRLDDLRLRSYGGHETPVTLGQPTVGAACPDDDTALCVALG